MSADEGSWRVSDMCSALGAAGQGYYAWRRRGPSARDLGDAELARLISEVYESSSVNVNPSFTDSTNAIAPIAPTHPRRFRRRQAPFPASRSGARSFVR